MEEAGEESKRARAAKPMRSSVTKSYIIELKVPHFARSPN